MDQKNNEAFKKLVEETRKDNRQETIILFPFGVFFVGFSLAMLLGILPSAIYSEAASVTQRKEARDAFLALGAVGLALVVFAIWKIIRPGPPSSLEDFWDDNST